MKRVITVLCCLCLAGNGFAQEQQSNTSPVWKNLKISGYVQGQFQLGQEDASLKVGSSNENPDKSFNRIGIRRGRIKFTYEEGIASGVFQLDITEKGIGFRDAYLSVKDPWVKTNSLKAGVFDRPFGDELSYSSSLRESPERSTVSQTLFPNEQDVGAMLTLQAAKTSPLNFLKLEAGLFAGNCINQETDSRKDFIGHLSAKKEWNNIQFGAGASYYNGGIYQGTENVYKMKDGGFVLDNNPANKGEYAKREYTGFDVELGTKSAIGLTQVRSEYLFGKQPGQSAANDSPNSSTRPDFDTYLRNFRGGYVMLAQDLGKLPLVAVLKYDWYDPNTKISKNEVGLKNTTPADISRNTFGFGMLWKIKTYLRLQAYYEVNNNQKTENIAAYKDNRKDNVFTLRMQYVF